MGTCSSIESTSVATAKLILEDGRLQEYPYPVTVSYVLQKINPASFICNSDEMGFDDVVSAVRNEEELQLGQLYFALPLSRLKRRLQAADMAALAVKASSALGMRGSGNVVVFSGKNALNTPGNVAGNVGSRRRRGKFAARLSAIPE
ncbi:HTH-type transcriptional regulator [Perilla frutescens var. hirtella]|nr:HTH-type transcriptional regulator [Perilla frutescens var. hirtella]